MVKGTGQGQSRVFRRLIFFCGCVNVVFGLNARWRRLGLDIVLAGGQWEHHDEKALIQAVSWLGVVPEGAMTLSTCSSMARLKPKADELKAEQR